MSVISDKTDRMLKHIPDAIEQAISKQKQLRVLGRDEEAAAYGLKIDSLRSKAIQIEDAKERRDLVVWYQACYGCGIRIDGDSARRRKALYDEWTKATHEATNTLSSDEFPRTPSARNRFLLSSGHRMQEIMRDNQSAKTESFEIFKSIVKDTYDTILGGFRDYTNEHDEPDTARKVDETFVHKMWSAYKWAEAGGNQFQITSDLAAALVLTDVPDIMSNEAKLPYETVVFSLPPNTVPFVLPDEGVKHTEWADTLWIERVDEGKYLWVIRWRELELHQLFDVENDAWFRDDSEEALASDDETSFQAAYKLVRNFALWLHAEGAAEMKRARVDVPKKLAEKRAKSGEAWPKQWLFGKEVKISPELRRAAMESVLGRSRHSVEGWKVRARFTVRGHWRNQVHGAGMQLRTRKWIAPYWKGPAEKEAWAHIYKPVIK